MDVIYAASWQGLLKVLLDELRPFGCREGADIGHQLYVKLPQQRDEIIELAVAVADGVNFRRELPG